MAFAMHCSRKLPIASKVIERSSNNPQGGQYYIGAVGNAAFKALT